MAAQSRQGAVPWRQPACEPQLRKHPSDPGPSISLGPSTPGLLCALAVIISRPRARERPCIRFASAWLRPVWPGRARERHNPIPSESEFSQTASYPVRFADLYDRWREDGRHLPVHQSGTGHKKGATWTLRITVVLSPDATAAGTTGQDGSSLRARPGWQPLRPQAH